MPSSEEIAGAIRQECQARGWGPSKLAREVGIAEGRGPHGVDRQSARRWMAGKRCPTYWLPYIARVLDLHLGDAEAAESDEPKVTTTDTVTSVIELGRSDVYRRSFLVATSGYALSALALPDLESITRRTKAAAAGAVRVGAGEVAAVEQMVKALGDSAAELGGGHARHLAVRYLTEDVGPWLNGKYTEATGRQLFAATSQLVHLAGWMAQDEGNTPENQGRAQQYYAHAYRLAAEAGDPELSATALRGMAVQAIDLGYRAEAVQLGEACVRYGQHLENHRAVAYYEATLANAAAQDDDRRTATRHLAFSEVAIGRPSTGSDASWAAHYSPGRWAHESGMILSRLGDLDAAEEHLHLALEIHGLDRRRTRAIVLADLGGVRYRQGDLDGALSTWSEFITCADGIRSVKVRTAIDDMRTRLNRCQGMPQADKLRLKAGRLLG
ncbi:tetratricopeptide repeat protein [Streptomyces sp. A3M-1-3]|uniref:tetratricopeptide repeat protein n=1 Tax=Streptomyces sp. A3M-1-3 TaxID=2962044 RepID=UPI0020B76736|nr:tetratricopeptide repeat protein [Streptomyces sp. A3M-1-3]MCP3817525.1 tetratricopeptide repeat protein [Streptomyces sp. A3M-1-3]